ncbi:MAG: CPBP family intramembrane glutamic endopeptidase, partial [Pirellulaceae bacterium]
AKGTVAAWCVILFITVRIVMLQASPPGAEAGEGKLSRSLFEFQVRYMVGAAALLGDQGDDALRQYLHDSESAPPWQQLRVGIVAGELSGPDAALKELRAIKESSQAGDTQAGDTATLDVLLRLYRDYSQDKMSAPSVSETERNQLQAELGWFGKLALAPPSREGPVRDQVVSAARKTFYGVLAGFVGVGLAGLLGLFVLIVFLALLFGDGLPEFSRSHGRGGVHAETFACWLLLFLALNMVGGAWFGSKAVIPISLFSLVGSLLALAWPVFRGVGWRQLRVDLGWTMGRGLVREMGAGVGGYAMAIPLVMLSLLLTLILLSVWSDGIEPGGAPVHPAARWLVEASWWQRAQLMFLACVVAPVLEETMFRGFLYRHVREATAAMNRWASVLLSALITSVLFAVLHPQGLLAAPGIIAIGLAFAFMREWRESLLPSMLAHALNNAVIMVALTALSAT